MQAQRGLRFGFLDRSCCSPKSLIWRFAGRARSLDWDGTVWRPAAWQSPRARGFDPHDGTLACTCGWHWPGPKACAARSAPEGRAAENRGLRPLPDGVEVRESALQRYAGLQSADDSHQLLLHAQPFAGLI